MWTKSYQVTTKEVTREQLWAVLTDIRTWNEWDTDIAWTTIEGGARLHAPFYLKPKGGPKTKLSITQLDKPNVFADVSYLPLAQMHTIHTLTQAAQTVTIRVEIRISGLFTFLWSKIIGQKQIDGGMQQTQRLIEKAKTK